MVESENDMRTAQGLADLDQLASRVAQIPGVTRVIGVTRPTGEKLQQAQLSWQNDQIGTKITEETGDVQARKGDLAVLKTGSEQLAGGLALLEDQISSNLAPLSGLLDEVSSFGPQLDEYRPLVNQLASAAPPTLRQFSQRAPELSQLARRPSLRQTRSRQRCPHWKLRGVSRSRSARHCARKRPTSGHSRMISRSRGWLTLPRNSAA